MHARQPKHVRQLDDTRRHGDARDMQFDDARSIQTIHAANEPERIEWRPSDTSPITRVVVRADVILYIGDLSTKNLENRLPFELQCCLYTRYPIYARRARPAIRPSASREQRYLTYNNVEGFVELSAWHCRCIWKDLAVTTWFNWH